MNASTILRSTVLAASVLSTTAAAAATGISGPGVDPGAGPAGTESLLGSSVDARDVMDRLLNRTTDASADRDFRQAVWLRVPVITSSPGSGTLLGGGTEVSFFNGRPATTQASTVVASAAGSLTGRVVAGVRLAVYGRANRWIVLGDNRFERASQNSFGLGTSTTPAGRFATSYVWPRMNDVALRQVTKSVYAGVGIHFTRHAGMEAADGTADRWTASTFADYSRRHGFDLRTQTSAGISANLRFDNRDSVVNATRGWLVSAAYRTYVKGLLGGDSNWQSASVDVRRYRALGTSGRHVLAAWAYADMVTSGVAPYFDLPATAMDGQGRSGRGYAAGRFRGERMVYGEIEYRGSLTRNGLLGVVAFVNTTTVSNRDTGERLFQSAAPGAGVGLRLLADKFSRTRIGIDVGVGQHGSHGVYLSLQETF
jgi:hypothetical protein